MAPAPALTPAPPRGLTLLDHQQTPKRPEPGVPGAFTTGSVAKMTVSDLNPGFIDGSDALVADTGSSGLQTCLQKLITTQFQNYLSDRSNTAASRGDRLRVALVDLSGDKIARPDFAGWGSTVAMYGASSPKILAVYAVHQLRADLRQLASTQSISSGAALEKAALRAWKLTGPLPNLAWLFDIRKWSGAPGTLDFTPAARTALGGIMHNWDAASLIVGAGFPYVASVTWQSGLFHPSRGGLWLTTSYGRGEWDGNPVRGVYSANITALSAATYFTLLAQGRLVDDAASAEMATFLRRGCITGSFPKGLGVVASKCGIWSDFLHDCALVRRGALRYVVVGLTRTRSNEYGQYRKLFQELDHLIVRNNETPRPSC
ncbi:MAG: serine hydrolase [Vicinamibacteria bacterium]